ncbi:MAG TPA: phytoene/squalene synthase family protein [Chthoniobacteraceae bacterium]|jgi:farnesyl-diphosphate farnesyltransferase|nr:phytoene/squalene synthase family protein [Chthoniobacteraceae bacterium]
MNPLDDSELMELLAEVSRSFVLTIRALPRALRRPVGLAYLLARASDTIADTATAPIEARVECLRAFVGNEDGASLREIRPAKEAESYLLANIGRVTAAAEELPDGDREEIAALLKKITHGQELDLLRFPDSTQVRALETAAELEEYTYLVAGCVGEFWTRICSAHLPHYGRIAPAEMERLGRAFGQGLQLVNILRDVPEDIANGRCYLPMAELRAAGIEDPRQLRAGLSRAAPVFEAWRMKALEHHEEARRYIEAVRPLRIRFACLLPWALGVRTLSLIGQRSPLEKGERIKVDRGEVRRMMRRAIWAALSNGSVERWSLALAQSS